MIEVEAPDGSIIEFPDGTDDLTIDWVMRQNFAPQAAQRPERGFQVLDRPLSETMGHESQQAAAPQVSGWDAFKRGFSDMGTFGTTDEVSGFINSMINGTSYESERDKIRRKLSEAQNQRPWTTGAGAATGGALQALFTAGLAGGTTAATTGARAAQGAKIGAAEGLAYGAGSGEGLGDRLGDAAKFGAMGGVIGGAAPLAVEGVRRGYRSLIGNPYNNITNTANPVLASEAVQKVMTRAGMSADDARTAIYRAMQEGQPEYTLADAMGVPGQRMLSGIARQPGDAGADIAQYLQQRQLDQPDRVAGFVQDAFGFRGGQAAQGTDLVPQGHRFTDAPADILRRPQTSAAGLVDDLTRARSATANAGYDAARKQAGAVDVRGAVASIDDRIGPMQGSGITGDSIDAKMSRYRSRLFAQPPGKAFAGADSVELSDFDRVLGVKQAIQDDIGAAVRAGRNNEARELGKVVAQLDQALEEASAGYRAANNQFRDASRVIDAVGQGADMIRPGARAVDTIAAFRGMNPDQQAAARIGYGDRALAKMESVTAPSTNRAKAFTSTKAATEADAMALNPELFRNRIGRENQMWETFNRGLGGSRTADNLADMQDTSSMTTGVLGNLLAGRLMEAGRQAGVKALNNVTGQSEATRALIAKMLISGDVPAAVAPALQALESRTKRSRVVEALMRSSGRVAQDYLSR